LQSSMENPVKSAMVPCVLAKLHAVQRVSGVGGHRLNHLAGIDVLDGGLFPPLPEVRGHNLLHVHTNLREPPNLF